VPGEGVPERIDYPSISLNDELDRRGGRLEEIEDVEELRDIAHGAGLQPNR